MTKQSIKTKTIVISRRVFEVGREYKIYIKWRKMFHFLLSFNIKGKSYIWYLYSNLKKIFGSRSQSGFLLLRSPLDGIKKEVLLE